MSEPDDNRPRRRVPKDPFANPPATPPFRPTPPQEPTPTRTPRSAASVRPADPEPVQPARRKPEPEPTPESPSRALIRVKQPDQPLREPDEEPRRRRFEDEDEPRPRHRKRAPDPEEVEEEPRRKKRDPFEEEDEAPPRRRRRDEEERDYPDEPKPRGRRREPESAESKLVRPLVKLLKWVRTLLEVSTVLYVTALIFILVTLEWSGEESVFTAALLYLPPYGWLAPLVLLAPMSLLFRPWLLPVHLVCVAGVLGLYMKYRHHEPLPGKGTTVTLVTNNIGESRGKSVNPFVQLENPDLIVLQDAGGRGPEYRRVYTNHYMAGISQFLLISKLPIKSAEIVPLRGAESEPVAACFEVDFHGRPLAIYSVHLPTARNHLEAVKGLGIFAMLFGKEGGHGQKVRTDSAKFWANQIGLARALAEHIEQDKRQCVIAGDFNAPNHGVVYRTFISKFTDAFNARGRGYGFSFPGDSRVGPWLRLDQVMSSERLVPIYCRTEEGRRSQHRAVVARFEWQ